MESGAGKEQLLWAIPQPLAGKKRYGRLLIISGNRKAGL